MENKVYFIYKYEWDDGSIYIGQTFVGSGRYGCISDYKRSTRVYRKMKSNPNFDKTILISNLSENEVDDLEIYYIKLYNSFSGNNKFGLNLTEGGRGIKNASE